MTDKISHITGTPTTPSTAPAHVAIIMDGNGRWAQAHGMERSAGHVEGVKTVRRITEAASRAGVRYLTLYTFSTENWNRPAAEVEMLMTLIVSVIEEETPHLIKNNVRMRVIGDMSRMPSEARARLEECVRKTSHCTGMTLVLAISYSSRWELVEATRAIAEKTAKGLLDPAEITSETIDSHLATAGMPDPDLLIRTGGDMRVSNFLLWQLAYTEIIVTDTFWPAFSDEEFAAALRHFSGRQRRFGLTGEQVTSGITGQQP